jgi:hypothetical protein
LVTNSTLRRRRVSEMWPDTGLSSSMGTKVAKPVTPTQAAEPVMR